MCIFWYKVKTNRPNYKISRVLFYLYNKKAVFHIWKTAFLWLKSHNYLPWCSELTVSFLRPCARRDASTRRPFLVAMRARKPCLFTRRRLCGWNVLFIVILFYLLFFVSYLNLKALLRNSGCKSTHIFWINKEFRLKKKKKNVFFFISSSFFVKKEFF